ncbi:MAG: penicillin-binding protein 2 [Candidatus Cloacimonadaceae bacterium]|nr:penicillin-binding protein 2 [Candidatus Cloacimonadaceae bacterium]
MNKITPVLVFRICLAILFTTLVVSLFRLQVIEGEYYKVVAQRNYVRILRIPATRGEIYDQKYRPIVSNIASHNLYLESGKITNLPALTAFLDEHFGMEEQVLKDLIAQNRFRTYEEILIADNLDYEAVLSLSEQLNYFPELTFRVGTTRHYQYPNHFTGYVGRINEKEYAQYRVEDYSINSFIGKTGLENFYEVLLRGKDGREIVQVDAYGRNLNLLRTDGMIAPVNGLGLVLTIDNDLQEFSEQAFPAGLRGAIVVMDVKTGGVLAYVSHPQYDPNIFMNRISPDVWASLNTSDKPMLDRVIHAAYPPGSVFKPITGAMGLELGITNRHTTYSFCSGGLQVGNRFFKCWLHSGHGLTNIVSALKVSCDVYFYDLSMKLGLDSFRDFTLKHNVCTKTGIDLPNERNGFFPSTEWYKKTFGQRISILGHKVNLAIGQGEILTTPLQICALYAAIANNGMWIQPHLLKNTVGKGRLSRHELVKMEQHPLPLSPINLSIIQQGLWEVCNAPGGTATHVKVSGATVYGKTGSAENSMGKVTHAWFAAYMVTDKPNIAVTVFLENAGGGGSMAAPVANKILNYYAGNIESITRPVPVPIRFRNPEDITAPETEQTPTVPDLPVKPESEGGYSD